MLILLDMDGVLVDSEEVILAAATKALAEFGVFAKRGDFSDFIGAGEDRFVGGVAEKHGVAYRLEMKKRTYEIYRELAPQMLKTYPDTVKTLQQLKDAGFLLALASSADLEKVKINLQTAGIPQDLFSVIVTGSDVQAKKPAPDIYQKAAALMHATPADCVVIEDAINGIQSAQAAGMRVIALTTSFSCDMLAEYAPDAVVDSLPDIVPILI